MRDLSQYLGAYRIDEITIRHGNLKNTTIFINLSLLASTNYENIEMTINLTIVLPFFNIFNSYVCLLRRLWFFIDSRAIWTQRWCFQRYRLRKCCWPRRPEGCPWDYGSYRTGRERIHEHHGSDPLDINICWGQKEQHSFTV